MKKLNAHTWETESDEGRYTLRRLVKTNTAGFQSVYDAGDRYVVEVKGEELANAFKDKANAMRFIKAGQKADAAKAGSSTGGTVTKEAEKPTVHHGEGSATGGSAEAEPGDGDSEDDSPSDETDEADKLKAVLSSVKDNDK